jgi:hypothetical protein
MVNKEEILLTDILHEMTIQELEILKDKILPLIIASRKNLEKNNE